MYHSVPVDPALRPFVRQIRVQAAASPPAVCAPYDVLPGPLPVLGIRISGELRLVGGAGESGTRTLGASGLTGLQDRPRHYLPDAGTRSILVALRPEGAFGLFGVPMDQVTNGELALDHLFPAADVRAAEERVAAAAGHAEAAAVVTSLLKTAARRSRAVVHPAVSATVTEILARPGRVAVERLARATSIGARQLERLFRAQVGMPPKRVAALARFAWAVEGLRHGVPLSQLALGAGFSDQAHFTRAVTRFAGLSPALLRAEVARGSVSQSFNT